MHRVTPLYESQPPPGPDFAQVMAQAVAAAKVLIERRPDLYRTGQAKVRLAYQLSQAATITRAEFDAKPADYRGRLTDHYVSVLDYDESRGTVLVFRRLAEEAPSSD